MKKLNKKGFTLIELIVVIAILAILAAILIPAVTGYITKATDSKNAANCRSLYAQTAMQVMLEQGTTAVDTADLDLTFVVDTPNHVLTSFTCLTKSGTIKTINPMTN